MKRIGVMAATAMIALLLALPLGLVMGPGRRHWQSPASHPLRHGYGRRFSGSSGDHDRRHGW